MHINGFPARVGLNAQLLSRSASFRRAGISGYIYNLLRHLPGAGPELDFTVWCPEQWHELTGMELRVPRLSTCSIPARILWEQLALPWEAKQSGISLLHGLAFALPLLVTLPKVVTIFDMSFVLYPECHPAGRRLYLGLMTRMATRLAEAVIAISESSKRDICRILRIPGERVVVTPLGVSEDFRKAAAKTDKAAFREEKGIGPYIYYQGTLEPRKNLVTLIEAYARLVRDGHCQHKLVIGGAAGWGAKDVHAAVERNALDHNVVFLGYVPDEESPQWYSSADVFAFPSIFEGFGLPPLEAMAAGVPVVASNTSSVPEVVGDAGILLPPKSVEEWAEALGHLLADVALRKDLLEKGSERARRYSWNNTARATVELYYRCLA